MAKHKIALQRSFSTWLQQHGYRSNISLFGNDSVPADAVGRNDEDGIADNRFDSEDRQSDGGPFDHQSTETSSAADSSLSDLSSFAGDLSELEDIHRSNMSPSGKISEQEARVKMKRVLVAWRDMYEAWVEEERREGRLVNRYRWKRG